MSTCTSSNLAQKGADASGHREKQAAGAASKDVTNSGGQGRSSGSGPADGFGEPLESMCWVRPMSQGDSHRPPPTTDPLHWLLAPDAPKAPPELPPPKEPVGVENDNPLYAPGPRPVQEQRAGSIGWLSMDSQGSRATPAATPTKAPEPAHLPAVLEGSSQPPSSEGGIGWLSLGSQNSQPTPVGTPAARAPGSASLLPVVLESPPEGPSHQDHGSATPKQGGGNDERLEGQKSAWAEAAAIGPVIRSPDVGLPVESMLGVGSTAGSKSVVLWPNSKDPIGWSTDSIGAAAAVVAAAAKAAVMGQQLEALPEHTSPPSPGQQAAAAGPSGDSGGSSAKEPQLAAPPAAARHPSPAGAQLRMQAWIGGQQQEGMQGAQQTPLQAAQGAPAMQTLLQQQLGQQQGGGGQATGDTSGSSAESKPRGPRAELQQTLEALQARVGPVELQIISPIGQGGNGVVYKGLWRGIEVAIKRIVFQDNAAGDKKRQGILREAALMSVLSHPNILTCYSWEMKQLGGGSQESMRFGVEDWHLYIIQEFADGGSLHDAIKTRNQHIWDPMAGQWRMDLALYIAADVAGAMAYLHSKSIIHADLKPDNILLKLVPGPGCGFLAKVGDFGLSVLMQGNQTHVSGVQSGTPLYIAPEVLRTGKASPASDVYAFGVVLWELYHGTTSWDHARAMMPDALQLVKSMRHVRGLFGFQEPCAVPALRDLVVSCLHDEPSARPSFVEIRHRLKLCYTQCWEASRRAK